MVVQLVSRYAHPSPPLSCSYSAASTLRCPLALSLRRSPQSGPAGAVCRRRPPGRVSMALMENSLVNDVGVSALTAGVALGLLRFWEEVAKRGVFDQKLNRKLVHISIGLVFMLFWPLFSSRYRRDPYLFYDTLLRAVYLTIHYKIHAICTNSFLICGLVLSFYSSGIQAPYLAALAPGVNIIRMLLMGLGIWRNEAMVKSISRHGDYRELLKGPLYYACTITLATSIFWRSSPISISAICNLCAGDGVADIVGRRFGRRKLPYNPNKSFAGSIAMAAASFLASIGYMHYLSLFGFMNGSWSMVVGFLVVSLAAAFVESLPISSEMDDNLTVPLTSVIVGCLVF